MDRTLRTTAARLVRSIAVGGVVADWLALRHHLNPAHGSLVLLDDVDEVHPIWQQAGLHRIGCVSLSGIADDEPRRAVPLSASSGFCAAIGMAVAA